VVAVEPGTVIYLNGSSSAGKGTLSRAIQAVMDEPYLHLGADTMFESLHGSGFNQVGTPDALREHRSGGVFWRLGEDRRVQAIEFGSYGKRMMRGLHAAIAAISRQGNHVVVDDVLFEPAMARHAAEELADLPAYLVGVLCDPDELERREVARGDRLPGLSRLLHGRIHEHIPMYDLEVDTTSAPAEAIAQIIRAHVARRPPPRAFRALLAAAEPA
jgi:chloramphenicol 3-O phosphotransferase